MVVARVQYASDSSVIRRQEQHSRCEYRVEGGTRKEVGSRPVPNLGLNYGWDRVVHRHRGVHDILVLQGCGM